MTQAAGWRSATLLMLVVALLLPTVRRLFFDPGNRWLYVLFLSFSITALLTPWVRRLAHVAGALDIPDGPDGRKIHAAPTALLGGVAVYVGVVASIVANGVWPPGLARTLIVASGVFLFSLADDLRPVGTRLKLAVFMLAAVAGVAAGARATVFGTSPLGETINAIVSFLWILGILNALNFLDGMDGLGPGLAGLIGLFTGTVAYQTGQPALGWAAAAVVGSCVGFFPFNFRPGQRATIFLGDAGSNFLGFVLASIALMGYWGDANPVVAISNPLLIFGILIYDMIHITVTRITSGEVTTFYEWIHYSGKDHFHHRLQAVLGNRAVTVVFILLVNVCLGLAALAVRRSDTVGALALLLQAVLILTLFTILERRGRRLITE